MEATYSSRLPRKYRTCSRSPCSAKCVGVPIQLAEDPHKRLALHRVGDVGEGARLVLADPVQRGPYQSVEGVPRRYCRDFTTRCVFVGAVPRSTTSAAARR